jgi:hypothetical protein
LLATSWNQSGFGSHHIRAASYHPGTSQGMTATTLRRRHKHILITDIDKQNQIKFQVTHQGLFGWSHEKTA